MTSTLVRIVSPVVVAIMAAAAPARGQAPPPRVRSATPSASPAPAPPPAPASAPATAGGVEPYRIGPEDLIDISVWNNDSVSRVVPVRPDGRISLPLLADVTAAGLTPLELRDVVRRGLAPYMNAPEVSVVVREVHSFKVSVLGQVKTPGRYEMKSRATVLDALAMAGGMNDFASRSKILILHQSSAGTVRKSVFNYTKFVAPDQVTASPVLEPGDVVIVQ